VPGLDLAFLAFAQTDQEAGNSGDRRSWGLDMLPTSQIATTNTYNKYVQQIQQPQLFVWISFWILIHISTSNHTGADETERSI
jgi:hypothetical protein